MRHDITSVLKNPLIAYYNIFDSEKIAEFAAIAPAPSKDFYHLLITPTKVSSDRQVLFIFDELTVKYRHCIT